MDEAPVTHVFTVRGRPVGFQPDKWGGALVAVERGSFPISCTGYRSLACERELSPSDVSEQFLEKLAQQQDRDRKDLLQRLREAKKPVGDPIMNYIHASGAYQKAVEDGFFATDRDRAALWAGAYSLLCLVDTDSRFQPVPDGVHPKWTAQPCAASLTRARALLRLLTQFASGDIPEKFPISLLSGNTYLALPPKPGGEPKIDLGGYTAEMALNLPVLTPARKQTRRVPAASHDAPQPEAQLGLFGPPSVATNAGPKGGLRPRIGCF